MERGKKRGLVADPSNSPLAKRHHSDGSVSSPSVEEGEVHPPLYSHSRSDHQEGEKTPIVNDERRENLLLTPERKEEREESGEEKTFDRGTVITPTEQTADTSPRTVEVSSPVLLPPRNSLLYGCRSVSAYKKLNKISEGTYGAVFRAREIKQGTIVALKLVKFHEKVWQEGFPMPALREMSILLELNHHNILNVQEVVVGNRDHQVFMVMEYVEHELKHLLDMGKPEFSVAERKCLLRQLLDGVRYLHENWVMHRDLKTSNLLYSNAGLLKICDFGMGRKFGEPTRPYTPQVVTLWYRAPELLLGLKNYTCAVDVWSAGCIFAELLLHKPIFDGKSEVDMLHRIFRITGTPTEDTWPEFSTIVKAKQLKIDMFRSSWRKLFPPLQTHFSAGSGSISTEGLDLLSKMLDPNPNTRITAGEALQHPYLTRERPSPVDVLYMPTVPDTNREVRKLRVEAKSLFEEDRRDRDAYLDVQSRFEGRVDARSYLQHLDTTVTTGLHPPKKPSSSIFGTVSSSVGHKGSGKSRMFRL